MQGVIPHIAVDVVEARAAGNGIVAGIAAQVVVTGGVADDVIALEAIDRLATGPADGVSAR